MIFWLNEGWPRRLLVSHLIVVEDLVDAEDVHVIELAKRQNHGIKSVDNAGTEDVPEEAFLAGDAVGGNLGLQGVAVEDAAL